MSKSLKLRGAIALLSSVLARIGRNQKTNEWSDGVYIDLAVRHADAIVQKALWSVEFEFRKINK